MLDGYHGSMKVIPVPAGDKWTTLIGYDLPDHEIMRVITYLGGAGPDDLVYTDWYGAVSGGLEEGEALEQLVLVGRDGTGRRLRRRGFDANPVELLSNVDAIYLCQGTTPQGSATRYAFIDTASDDKPKLVCHRKDFTTVFAALRMAGTGGVVWRGAQVEDDAPFTEMNEADYVFDDGLIDAIIADTVAFLTGDFAAKLRSWDVAPKRSVVLHGEPGNGKTVLTRICARRALRAGLNVVIIEGRRRSNFSFDRSSMGLGDELRQATARGPCLVIFEDIDLHCERRPASQQADARKRGDDDRPLAEVLDFLDGVVPTDGYALIATTNYLDRLDDALLRPGRIDKEIEVRKPGIDARRALLRRLIEIGPSPAPAVESAAEALDGASFADLAEVVRRYKIAAAGAKQSSTTEELLRSRAHEFARERNLGSVQHA